MRILVIAALVVLTAPATSTAASVCDLAAPNAARAGPGCAQAWMDRHLRMNDILTMGTHNSYKQAISEPIMALIRAAAPKDWQSLDYGHPPLTEQLEDGARALELDLVHDPDGGRFSHPAGMKLTLSLIHI